MSVEPQNPPEDETQQRAAPVTGDAFAAVDIEAPIHGSNKVDCWSLARLYRAAASEQDKAGNEIAARIFGLLSAILGIHFKPKDRSEPYGPRFVNIERDERTMIPEDLRGVQSAVIAEVAPAFRNPGLRARLADIAWLNDKQLASTAFCAIDAYCEAVQLVLDGKAEFFIESWTATSRDGCNMLRRACQIARATGWKDPGASRLKALVRAVVRDAVHRRDHRAFFRSGYIALQFSKGLDTDPARIASKAETFAASEDVDSNLSHYLWKLAALAHKALDNQQDRVRCLASAAESLAEFWVKIGDAAGGKGMVAANAYRNAIQALGSPSGTKERQQEIEQKLRRAQPSVRDEMGVTSTPFDLTDSIECTRQSISGLPLPLALGKFAGLAQAPEPDELRGQAEHIVEKYPFFSMMSSMKVDEEGKVVAESPGMFGSQEDFDNALHHPIAQNEDLRRQNYVHDSIEPARQIIQSGHSLYQDHLRLIAAMTPYVPDDWVDLVATGLARFFGGDFISALHILVPQLERSLRHILEQAGVDPSAIRSDMTQEDLTLSVMLKKHREYREPLEEILGPAVVFEIENLFDFRGGPYLRHRVAHGRVSSYECYSTDSIYACWFIFRLFCLPLFPHWDEVARRMDGI